MSMEEASMVDGEERPDSGGGGGRRRPRRAVGRNGEDGPRRHRPPSGAVRGVVGLRSRAMFCRSPASAWRDIECK